MEFHQIVVSAAPRDAVTNSAMEIRKLLRLVGPSDIFAKNVDGRLAGDVFQVGVLADGGARRLDPSDVVIFHGSIGDAEVVDIVRRLPCRVILMYHNISPPAHYQRYDAEFAEMLREGRQQMARLRPRVAGALAPSEFNADELRAMGYTDVRVTPLIIERADPDIHRRDRALDDQLSKLDGPLFLFVGQLLPHKRPDFLLQAFHVIATYLLPGANLAMVGASRLPSYRRRLDAFIQELSLPGLQFLGSVSDDALESYYARADAFVTATEHEGFCVPLIEAMAAGVPVVARNAAAVPWTLDGAGLCVDRYDSPFVFAEAMLEIVSNHALRNTLRDRGLQRASAFTPELAKKAFLVNLLDLAS